MTVSKKRCLRFFSSPAYGKSALARRFEALVRGGDTRFLLIYLEIAHFDIYQKALGTQAGDGLRARVIQAVKKCAASVTRCLYGPIGEEAFALILPFAGEEQAVETAQALESCIREGGGQYAVRPRFGLCVIDDFNIPFDDHFEGAVRAAATVRDQDSVPYAFFDDTLRAQIRCERALVRDFSEALREKQFVLRIQPKYDIQYNAPVGGDALIRWQHPREGLLMPEAFLPALERYGLLPQLDACVWEEACRLLRKWTDEGHSPRPLSVRVSRAHFYDPQFERKILSLVEQYALPPALLSLEVNGDAYADDPNTFGRVLNALRAHGFTVLMDDFGDGSSSLDMLKNISVDLFKIDMRTILTDVEPERGLNLLASAARIAKCLGLPVVVEGVEQAEEADFLRGIGCEYAQGFYYAKPMPPEKYISLEWLDDVAIDSHTHLSGVDALWSADLRIDAAFNDPLRAAAIYEFDTENEKIECLRVNRAYCDLFGYEDAIRTMQTTMTAQESGDSAPAYAAFRATALSGRDGEYELLRRTLGGRIKWVRAAVHALGASGGKMLILCVMSDITAQVVVRRSMPGDSSSRTLSRNVMLIVDDQRTNRDMLRRIFGTGFEIIEAENGLDALKALEMNPGRVDIILLDMRMPVMDGESFLQRKKALRDIEKIPVVIMTSDSAIARQSNLLAIGANDYILRPLIPETAIRRVNSVLETSNRFRALLKEYHHALEQSRTDPLTRVYNRIAMEEAVSDVLKHGIGETHALVMIDLDHYKSINDTYGHSDGDVVLTEFANRLIAFFRSGDLIARMGGDEFCVLMQKIRGGEDALAKCSQLCAAIAQSPVGEGSITVTCSVGIAVSKPDSTFNQLYRAADIALYRSKALGMNRATLYREEDSSKDSPFDNPNMLA